jgi:GTPase SAR1 family protein
VIYDCVSVPGTGAYDNVRPLAYQDAKVFLLCFRVSDPDSLDNAVSKVCGLCVVLSKFTILRSYVL